MDTSPTAAFVKNAAARYTYVNAMSRRRFGVSPGDCRGPADADLRFRETAELFRENNLAVLSAWRAVELIETTRRAGGGSRYSDIFRSRPVRRVRAMAAASAQCAAAM